MKRHLLLLILLLAAACPGKDLILESGQTGEYRFDDPQFFRPAEVDLLIGDASKAKKVLGWKPEISYEQLVKRMVESDIKLLAEGKI